MHYFKNVKKFNCCEAEGAERMHIVVLMEFVEDCGGRRGKMVRWTPGHQNRSTEVKVAPQIPQKCTNLAPSNKTT